MRWQMAMGLQPTFEDRKKETLVKQCKKNGIYISIYKRDCFFLSAPDFEVFLNTYRLSYI